MAACKSVVVLCPNARRQTVKVGPTTTILQILEEVCKKQGLSSLEHAIKHQRKILDETLPIRYSGLSNNAHLEIVPQTKSNKQDAPCTIALQLASGERLLKEFPPAHSLWDVIQHWNSQQDSPHHQKLLGEEGQDVVCVYMTQRVSGELTLKKTTLHSLGLTGKRAIIRLLHEEASSSNPEQVSTKPTTTSSLQEQESSQQPLKTPNITIPGNMNTPSSLQQEPHAEQSTIPVSEEPKTSSASSMEVQETQDKQTENRHRQLDVKTVSPDRAARDPKRTRIAGPNPLFPDFKFPDRPLAEASKSQAPIVTEERLHYLGTPCERCAVVYRENDETITLTNQDVPDSFYEVTVDDIQKMLQQLHSERSKSEDMPLLTKAMRESRKIEELTKYEKVVIRIKFPDRLILQGFFRPQEKVSTLTEFVKSHLEDPNELFELYTTPPKTVLKNQNDTLYNVHLCPAALVYFGAKDKKETYLASHLLDNLATALDAEKSVVDSGIRCLSSTPMARPCMPQTLNNVNTATNNTNTTSNNSASSTNNAAPLPRGASGKVPKWFKGVGK